MARRGKNSNSNRAPSAKNIMQKILPHAYNPPNVPPTLSKAPWQALRVTVPTALSPTADTSITVAQVMAACNPTVTSGTHTFVGEIRFLRVQARIILSAPIATASDVCRMTPCDPTTGFAFGSQQQRCTPTDFGTLGFDYGAAIAARPLNTSSTVVAVVNATSVTFDVLYRLISVS